MHLYNMVESLIQITRSWEKIKRKFLNKTEREKKYKIVFKVLEWLNNAVQFAQRGQLLFCATNLIKIS